MKVMIIITLLLVDIYLSIRIFDYVGQFISLNLQKKDDSKNKPSKNKEDFNQNPLKIKNDDIQSLLSSKEKVGEDITKVKINV